MSDLPPNATQLGLILSFPASSLNRIQQGYVAMDQDDKWSIYYCEPWLQVWRPDREHGSYCYAVRFEDAYADRFQLAETGGRIRVAEAFASAFILGYFGGPDVHADILVFLLTGLADHPSFEALDRRFQTSLLSGRREAGAVSFEGKVRTLSDVEEVAARLRSEVALLGNGRTLD